MAEMIPVNIVIGDRNYRIKADPKDEGEVAGDDQEIDEDHLGFSFRFQEQRGRKLMLFSLSKSCTFQIAGQTLFG